MRGLGRAWQSTMMSTPSPTASRIAATQRSAKLAVVIGLWWRSVSRPIHEDTDAGHTVAAHGWSQHVIPAYQTAEEEQRDLARFEYAFFRELDEAADDVFAEVLSRAAGSERVTVELAPACRAGIRASAELVRKATEGDAPVYGVNTGFG